ncbi:tetraspanin Tsp2 [Coprinellus micaceus]|uniref:Tetraspanin Tsp2 n=1 Tax=Coprinellus micaceus TaxID=71717 RepID=A0A4Y7STQ6_COPMI|nr:tetraspanin Tsp2 [Coprinellus micaceus]
MNAGATNNRRSSRRASVAGSAYSAAGSTRHMLADFNGGEGGANSATYLNVPRYAGLPASAPSSPTMSTSGLSLSVNYLPSKFSDNILTTRSRRRSGMPLQSRALDALPPKQGGGLAAFKSGEARIGGKGLRWTKFKWILFFANVLLSAYSLVALVFTLLAWFDAFEHADIIRVANKTELVLSTIAAGLGLFTSVIGWAGILMNNRGFLAWYALFTWITFAFLVTPGYITYRKFAYNLEGKVNLQWSQKLGAMGRMKIQDQLQCCGYYSPYVEATVSQTCYARSVLPGCKKPFWQWEEKILRRWWTAAFALVPGQLLVMISALMCSNHVTYRFGKGMMPERYRLDMSSMGVIMDQYANQLAEQYGPEVASKVLERSKSNLNVPSAGR